MNRIKLGNRYIGEGEPVYIIAEIGSNFDGDLTKAKELIRHAKDCGCDCAKFQSFLPDKIISAKGFENKSSFQSKWAKSVYETYKDASLPREWHEELACECGEIGIDFMSTPYDCEATDLLNNLGVPAFKIGSGEIDNLEFIRYVALKKKPVILATGASNMNEIAMAVNTIVNAGNQNIILLQCVTQYPTPIESANIKAMATLEKAFGFPVGYSDHSESPLVAYGAVALGACVIEKHFTLNKRSTGPDHPFAADRVDMESVVIGIRKLEKALGSPIKQVEECEKETRILQRRGLTASRDVNEGDRISAENTTLLRPATGIKAKDTELAMGRIVLCDIKNGEPVKWEDVGL